MDVSNENTAKAAAVNEDQEPFKNQHLKEWGPWNSSVLVYDWEQKTVQVRAKRDVGQYSPYTIHCLAN